MAAAKKKKKGASRQAGRRRIVIRCGKCGRLIAKNYKAGDRGARTIEVLEGGLQFRIVDKPNGVVDVLCPDKGCGGTYRTTFDDMGMGMLMPKPGSGR